MTARISLLLLLALGSTPGCCFTPPTVPAPVVAPSVPAPPALPPGMPAMPGVVAPGAPLPGAGVLPTPALSFTGVVGPMPTPGVPVGTPGDIVTSGTATVRIATGALPGVASGTVCSYAQFRVPAGGPFDCRWNVTCGTSVVYGLGEAGYQVCTNASWPPGTLMVDTSMTAADGDPMFIFNGGGLTIGDDTGPLGAYNLTMTVP